MESSGGVVRVGVKVCVFVPLRLIEGEIEKIFTSCNERGWQGMGLIRASGAEFPFAFISLSMPYKSMNVFVVAKMANEAQFLQITRVEHMRLVKTSTDMSYYQ